MLDNILAEVIGGAILLVLIAGVGTAWRTHGTLRRSAKTLRLLRRDVRDVLDDVADHEERIGDLERAVCPARRLPEGA